MNECTHITTIVFVNWPNDFGHFNRALSWRPNLRCLDMRKSYSSEFKLKAASMVLDEGQSVPDVCASLDIGPSAVGSTRFV